MDSMGNTDLGDQTPHAVSPPSQVLRFVAEATLKGLVFIFWHCLEAVKPVRAGTDTEEVRSLLEEGTFESSAPFFSVSSQML